MRGRLWLWLGLGLAGLAVALTVLPVLLKPWQFVADDPYYYLQVAYNLVQGHGSTFSRVTPTNGYHPLWVGLVMLAEAVAVGHRVVALRLVIVVDVALLAAIAVVFVRGARSLGLRHPYASVAWLIVFFTTGELYASEAYLSALLLVALAPLLVVAVREERAAWWALAGALSAAAVLARLDDVFVVGALDLAAALALLLGDSGSVRRRWTRLAVLVAAGAAVMAPYLLWNVLAFGHLMPISGAIKGGFPHVVLNTYNVPGIARAFAVAAIVLIPLAWLEPLPRLVRLLFVAAALGYLAQVAYVALFVRFAGTWYWYYVPGALLTGYAIALVLQLPLRGRSLDRRWLRGLEIALISALLVVSVGRAWGQYENSLTREAFVTDKVVQRDRYALDIAAWLDANLPKDSGVYAWDWAGTLGYYSHARVLPVDGLINDYAYADDIARQGVASYLAEHRVGYYVGPIAPSQAFVSPLDGRSAGELALGDQRLLVRVRDISDAAVVPDWGVYRLSSSSSSTGVEAAAAQ